MTLSRVAAQTLSEQQQQKAGYLSQILFYESYNGGKSILALSKNYKQVKLRLTKVSHLKKALSKIGFELVLKLVLNWF